MTADGREVAFALQAQERFITNHHPQMLIRLRTRLPPT
jgi:hypothetical protein